MPDENLIGLNDVATDIVTEHMRKVEEDAAEVHLEESKKELAKHD